MGRLKKYSNAVVFILLLIIIVYGYIWISSRSSSYIDPRYAIPKATAGFIEFNKSASIIHELLSGNKIWNEVQKIKEVNEFNAFLHKIDSLIVKDSQLNAISGNRITVSLSLKSNHDPGLLFIIPMTVKDQKETIFQIFRRHNKNFNYVKRRYESHYFYDLSWSGSKEKKNFCLVFIKGLAIGSFSCELVEDAVRQINEGISIMGSPGFQKIMNTAGQNVSANIFINYSHLPDILRYLSLPSGVIKESGFSEFADWGILDMELFSNRVILNGFSSVDDTTFREMELFKGQDPVTFSSLSLLPSNVCFFKLYGFSNIESYFNNLRKKFQTLPADRKIEAKKNEIHSKYNINLDNSIRELIDNEYGLAILPVENKYHEYFFMKLKSQSVAEEYFKKIIESFTSRNGLNPDNYYFDAKIDNNTIIPSYHLPLGGIPSMIFGDGFKSVGSDYFTFVNNYIIFSNSFESLKYFVYQVILGNTITSDLSYNSIKEYISSQCNNFIYLKPFSSLEMIIPSFKPDIRESISSSWDNLRKFNIATIQFSATENTLYNRIFLNFSGQVYDNVNTIWESHVDTPIDFKPAIVLNHNTGEKEILIQDRLNQVYLLSNAGVILWKIKIDGPILSDIAQVDYYKNKKLQYLFNTSSRIYLIDRNGNPVEKFPVELRVKAASGMSVFDYDKDGTLRICLPAEDREIYMYDIEGKIIPGWKSRKTDNLVTRPLQHFRINDKDYIIAIDKFKFYIFDRRGNVRINPSKSFPVSEKNLFYLDWNSRKVPSGFITTDTIGNIIKVNLDGRVEKIIKQKLSPDHHFISADLNGDRKTEYLYTYGNKLLVTNIRGKEIFSDELSDKIEIKPLIYNFGPTDNKIGIVLHEKGIIYLYNNDGSLYRGFPLEGSSSFSISNFPGIGGKFNLIVGSKENFLLNYSVQ